MYGAKVLDAFSSLEDLAIVVCLNLAERDALSAVAPWSLNDVFRLFSRHVGRKLERIERGRW